MPQGQYNEAVNRKGGSDFLSVAAAAEVLGVTTRSVRNRLVAGTLGGRQSPNGRWEVDARSIATKPVVLRRQDGHDDTGLLLELALLRSDNAALKARADISDAKVTELARELARTRAVGAQLLRTVEAALEVDADAP